MQEPQSGWRPALDVDDPEAATAAIRRSMPAASVESDRPDFRFHAEQYRDERLDLTRWGFRARVDGGRSTETSGVTLVVPGGGVYEWTAGDERGDQDAPFVMRHGVGYHGRSEDMHLTIVRLEQTRFDDLAAAVRGDDPRPVRFAQSLPPTREGAEHLARTVALQAAVLEGRAAGSSALVAASVYRLLVVGLLESVPTEGADDRERTCRRRMLATVDRACRYIDDHAALPITVADIARHVGTSEAGLRRAFGFWRSRAPEAELERARLAGAHRDLLAAEPGDDGLIDTIAARWGHASPRRFATRYRAVYTVGPEDTLRAE
ncbi:hypothetical protein DEI92_04545 [Curtobacterium sp. MCBD17_034]|uniref:helix-turn-helix domain-containing protein n=1 Tax=unclassified Curtobacterium TaxID=257496 RepID=UPI000DA8F67F|nr:MULTISPECIES: AraC family transcriptional regulator [unclassified Curtobacterium]PZF60910.1 hypothetical protein DEI92_04545 [Curtobacterium sp. MCBD17_034]PZM40259.1 hypothetical protein DEI90_00780 [Curtobacterium sp. MCBD17_031]WIE55944.1 AraC family transcriptional regulator [Curtobacterium sp. MCBD17_003]